MNGPFIEEHTVLLLIHPERGASKAVREAECLLKGGGGLKPVMSAASVSIFNWGFLEGGGTSV